jgi:hypothetical protein
MRWRDLCTQPAQFPGLPALPLGYVGKHRVVTRGSLLFGNGDPLSMLYELQSGGFKTCVCAPDGRQQVTGFQLAGDWLGLDGIDTGATAWMRWRWKTRRCLPWTTWPLATC